MKGKNEEIKSYTWKSYWGKNLISSFWYLSLFFLLWNFNAVDNMDRVIIIRSLSIKYGSFSKKKKLPLGWFICMLQVFVRFSASRSTRASIFLYFERHVFSVIYLCSYFLDYLLFGMECLLAGFITVHD